jgi:hypothetical protein
MAREKVRCIECKKWFTTNNSRQIKCDDCLHKERAARPAQKAEASVSTRPKVTVAPLLTGPAATSLVADMSARPPASPPAQAPVNPGPAKSESAAPRRTPPPAPPKPKAPPPPPFVLTDELRAEIEQRYLELANPVEFDGIRTQIARKLAVPKSAVREVVHRLRKAKQIPSWWELRAYSGSDEDLERIRAIYVPALPVPPVGIHKQIAQELNMSTQQVYAGIRNIRAALQLPQFNPPSSHPELAHTEDVASPDAAPQVDAAAERAAGLS